MSNLSTSIPPPQQASHQGNTPKSVLWASVNHYQDAARIYQLQQEHRTMRRLFRVPAQAGQLKLLSESPSDHIFWFDILRQHQHDPAVQVLHLSGFNMGRHLHVHGGLGEEAWLPANLAHLIQRLSGLKLVVLNGCATQELLLALLAKDIPAILATQVSHERSDLIHLTYRLYESLLTGSSLKQAFARIQRLFRQPLPLFQVHYNLEQDQFDWSGQPAQVDDTLPWGLYHQAHHPELWDWCLYDPGSSSSPQQASRAPKTPQSRPLRMRLGGLL